MLRRAACSWVANRSQERLNHFVEFLLLGPIAVRDDGAELPIGGPKPRLLLAVLMLRANSPVSRDTLIDALWAERAPASAAHTLDSYISRLRRVLGQARLETALRRGLTNQRAQHREVTDVGGSEHGSMSICSH